MRPSIWEACHHAPRAAYPRAGRATRISLLFGLAPGGVYLADVSPRLRCALTAPFHPYLPAPRSYQPKPKPHATEQAVCFLWHLPAGFPDWPLASTLLYGVRTFLPV